MSSKKSSNGNYRCQAEGCKETAVYIYLYDTEHAPLTKSDLKEIIAGKLETHILTCKDHYLDIGFVLDMDAGLPT